MDKPYTIALMGWPDLSINDRIAAEIRFVTALEAELGGPDGVAAALAADEALMDELTGPDDMRPLESAFELARPIAEAEGWKGLPERPARAFFKVIEPDAPPAWG